MHLSAAVHRSHQAFLLELGRAILPPTDQMPGFDQTSLDRMEHWLEGLSPDQRRGIRAATALLQARLGWRGAREPAALQAALRSAQRRGGPAQWLLHAGLMPLKAHHFGRPEVWRAMGLQWPGQAGSGSSAPLRAEAHRGEVGPGDLAGLTQQGVDVAVVGSGAGGAVVAAELAARGLAVLVIEEGKWFDRRDFAGPALHRTSRMYRNAGLLSSLGNPPVFLPVGATVGGTTTINSGTCLRARPAVLDRWAAEGLPMLSHDNMCARYERVEAVLRVTPAESRWVGEVGRIIGAGCDALGLEHGPLPRNAPDCDAQAQCSVGCPTAAKRSADQSWLPLAAQRGAAILPETRVLGAEMAGSEVRAVRVRHLPTGGEWLIPVRQLVVAAGTLHTPALLQSLGVRSPWLGRNLSIHPAGAAWAAFDRDTDPLHTIPQGHGIDAFADAGMVFEGGTVPPELAASAMPLLGQPLQDAMRDYKKLANFGFLVEDHGVGRVLGRAGDLPVVHYPLAAGDVQRIHRGLQILAEVFLSAGAKWVRPLLYSDLVLRNRQDLRRFSASPLPRSALQLSAFHPLGTARMARYARDGVVDARGRVHGATNLWVADGSVLPSSPGVNPQETIMAIAELVAEHVGDAAGAPQRKRSAGSRR